MGKNSKSEVHSLIQRKVDEGIIPKRLAEIVQGFYDSYMESISREEDVTTFFCEFIENIAEQCQSPFAFDLYHRQIREPYNYYQFGVDFLKRLVIKEQSQFLGREHLPEIRDHVQKGHNVVFFANHQTEADPQIISLFLEEHYQDLAEKMIFVAGERVITDPLAIPFSLGCNLLCIYSKRYIDHPPEKKLEKQLHNKRTMNRMGELLKEGGQCIYVAPSGGRDRRGETGEIEIAPFDPSSIEMFTLIAKKAKTPTFFYPMALKTYDILAPPKTIQVELGEMRKTQRAPAHIAIGKAIDMENVPGRENHDKHVRRKCRSDYIWDLVHKNYQRFPEG